MNSCDEAITVPLVNVRVGCAAEAQAAPVNPCPNSEFPSVTVAAAVPSAAPSLTNNTVTLFVNPTAGIQIGNWVVVGTASGAAPFEGRVVDVTATTVSVYNGTADSKPILTNPPAGTIIPTCAAIVVTGTPANDSLDPVTRCETDMSSVTGSTTPLGLQALTRDDDSALASPKCRRFVHNVGTDGLTFWAKNMPGMQVGATVNTSMRLSVFDSTNKVIKWLDNTTAAEVLPSITSTGAVVLNTKIPAAVIPDVSGAQAAGFKFVVKKADGTTVSALPADLGLTQKSFKLAPTRHQLVNGTNAVPAASPPAGIAVVNTMTRGAFIALTGMPTTATHIRVWCFATVDSFAGDTYGFCRIDGRLYAYADQNLTYDSSCCQVEIPFGPDVASISFEAAGSGNLNSNLATHVGSVILLDGWID